ncbi:hypothetical protein DID96_31380 [Burkholderia sp. Bp8963]|uniref:hypothetical protein n=1 Tax=Burkholderia sp. Bp8963 TaxID=2184547 RepID=UPI000F5A7D41|nr:hypothetical protein [Burkholderia sp. Bp8963]RQS62511.1 hypothetical protein DID96_31380 [Burkholderia sp. Bp8963]
MEPAPWTSLHPPDPPMPDVEPDPASPNEDDELPPEMPEPYLHPVGDPPEHRPPKHEPPVYALPAPSAGVPAGSGGVR